jgi:tripartite-type tricarboxylate transporter receptor subunit TctC
MKNYNSTRRALLKAAMLAPAMALPALRGARAQQTYPNRPVRVVLPFAAGGVADITARIVAEKLSEKLKQQFVIENQAGAGGITAARSVLSAAPDGYTLALLSNGTAISVPLFKSLPFNPMKDFTPISSFGFFDFILAANEDSQLRTIKDFANFVITEPGRLNVGTINVGSTQNLSAELLKVQAGIEFQIIPYRGTPEAVVGLLRNDVHLVIDTYAALKAGITDKKLRPLAVSGLKRSPVLPDVPTVDESGVKGYDVTSWNGLFAHAGTPPEVPQVLNRALREILAAPDVKQSFLELGIQAAASSPQELGTRLKLDIDKWTQVIKTAGIQQQ